MNFITGARALTLAAQGAPLHVRTVDGWRRVSARQELPARLHGVRVDCGPACERCDGTGWVLQQDPECRGCGEGYERTRTCVGACAFETSCPECAEVFA